MLSQPLPDLCATLAEAASEGGSSQQALAGMLIALGVVIMVLLLGISARSKSARRNSEGASPRERIEQIKAAGSHHQSGSAPLAQQVDRIQEMSAMLDNKAERLEQLLAEADERIALLRALNHRDSPLPEPPDPVDPLTRSVYELADEGRNSVEIAQELDEQVGKVDLILALRGR